MAFRLGNFNIDEILFGVAQNFNDELQYTLDELSSASIEISSEATDITDKKGNIVRKVYRNKTGTLTATNAFLHPAIMNAASGADIERASAEMPLQMPAMEIVPAGKSVTLKNPIEGTVRVIGLYGNGANSEPFSQSTTADDTHFGLDADGVFKTPVIEGSDAPIQYMVKYERMVDDGIKLVNNADEFPGTVRLTLYCSYIDPCSDSPRPCYVYIPSFQVNPSVTISLDVENQTMDYTGDLQVDYCGTEKLLYAIYFPNEDLVTVGALA